MADVNHICRFWSPTRACSVNLQTSCLPLSSPLLSIERDDSPDARQRLLDNAIGCGIGCTGNRLLLPHEGGNSKCRPRQQRHDSQQDQCQVPSPRKSCTYKYISTDQFKCGALYKTQCALTSPLLIEWYQQLLKQAGQSVVQGPPQICPWKPCNKASCPGEVACWQLYGLKKMTLAGCSAGAALLKAEFHCSPAQLLSGQSALPKPCAIAAENKVRNPLRSTTQ